jgi:hypothetical protein
MNLGLGSHYNHFSENTSEVKKLIVDELDLGVG